MITRQGPAADETERLKRRNADREELMNDKQQDVSAWAAKDKDGRQFVYKMRKPLIHSTGGARQYENDPVSLSFPPVLQVADLDLGDDWKTSLRKVCCKNGRWHVLQLVRENKNQVIRDPKFEVGDTCTHYLNPVFTVTGITDDCILYSTPCGDKYDAFAKDSPMYHEAKRLLNPSGRPSEYLVEQILKEAGQTENGSWIPVSVDPYDGPCPIGER